MATRRGVSCWIWLLAGWFVLLGFARAEASSVEGQRTRPRFAQAAAAPAGASVTIRGKITTIDGQRLAVATATGPVWVTLEDPVRVLSVVVARLGDITPGSFVGSGARRQADGTLRAMEVHIFPESMRGTGEGHRPMAEPETTMTNANVEEVVERVEGSRLTLKYKQGVVKIVVNPDTPIVRYVPGDRGLITPGAGVVLRGTQSADGSVSVSRINVGVDGLTP